MKASRIITVSIILATASVSFANTKCAHKGSNVGMFAHTVASSSVVAKTATQPVAVVEQVGTR